MTDIKKELLSKIKHVFLRSKIYYIIEPFSNTLMNIIYISKFIKWIDINSKHSPDTLFKDKFELYDFLLKTLHLDGDIDYLEFGVASGRVFKWWVENNKNPSSRFIGFDTFTGLPDDWGMFNKGKFSTNGNVPEINDKRVRFIVGMFQDTMDNFLKEFSFNGRKVIHLDADLYSSTHFVLASLGNKLQKGDILIFDEFAAWRTADHEFRAFCDFIASFNLDYKFVGAAKYFTQVAVQII